MQELIRRCHSRERSANYPDRYPKEECKFSVGANLAKDLIPRADIGVDLAKLQRENYLEITAARAAYRYFTLEEQLKLTPTRSCLDAIALLKQRGTFEGQVFVVPAVYSVQRITYEFKNLTEVSSEIRANIDEIVEAAVKAGYTSTTSGSGTEIISNDGWITLRTARPVLIREWDVSGLVGPQREVTILIEDLTENVEAIRVTDNGFDTE